MEEAKRPGTLDYAGVIFNPPSVRAWVVNSSGTRYQHEGNQAVTASIKQNLGLLSMFYDGTNFTTKIDGTQWKTATATGVLQSLPTTPVRLGQSHNIKFGEFVVFNDTLSSANELKMEGLPCS